MKKFLSVMAIMFAVVLSTVVFSSCSSDDDDETSFCFLKNPYVTFTGYTAQLPFNGKATYWYSTNDFVASVKDDGTMTANHVGKCEIIASSGNQSARCTIDVRPIHKIYTDPLLEWGASMDDVKKYEKRSIVKEEPNGILYKIDNSVAKGLMYVFKNGRLSNVVVLIEHNYDTNIARQVAAFLKERYRVISVSSTVSYFSDGKDMETSSTLVIVELNPSGHPGTMAIYYTPYEV